ncbi:hypothetical protein MGYG_09125 [Nannizzia gypsea CBS 118893]|uniref:Uncharacterized protein n=1 Tax=Arthroderma gypseum (strain ATCC MYA-4604 / CBS 118893) TaxID=535722 RepID=E4UZC8_ARTGP|nr:hypothetical protein MGYG_09125 [Nannizzia gypsea CBS 118893]EFR03458.1 hypothetical protein MGYG_09125 [Nannizzia gypsea CBS 118893]
MKFSAVLALIPFLAGALAAPSPNNMLTEAPMQQNSDMDASSQLLSITAAQCPPSHPLLFPAVQRPAAPLAPPTAEVMATATAVDKGYLHILRLG